MPKVKLNNETYEVPDMTRLTFREQNWIKRIGGLRMGEYGEAAEAGDSDLYFAMFAIAKRRADGSDWKELEALLDTEVLEIEFLPDEEDEPLPLPVSDESASSTGKSSQKARSKESATTSTPEASGTPPSSSDTASVPES